MIIKLFKEFSPSLAALEGKIDEYKITDILFAQRFDEFTAHIGVDDLKTAETILGRTLPKNLRAKKGCRYGFDLDSLETDRIRFYFDVKEPTIRLKGFILDKDLNIIERKLYKKGGKGKASILIDKFDASGKKTVSEDPEDSATIDDWKGPKEIYDIAVENSLNVIFLKKLNRDQTYIRIQIAGMHELINNRTQS